MQNRDYVITCCSTADMPPEFFRRRNIPYVCFHYSVDGVEYSDDLGQSMSFETFYNKIRQGAETRTSQVSIGEFCDFFRPFVDQGLGIIHVSFSSGLSGAWSSACIARDMLLEEYPDARIYVVDSLCASTGYGMFLDCLADAKDDGKTLEELYEYALEIRFNIHHWFLSTELKWYVKGGRLSPSAALIGNILGICPVLCMDGEGHLTPVTKVRTKKKALRALVDKVGELGFGGREYEGKLWMCHSDCYEDALALKEMLEKQYPKHKGEIIIADVGTVIGSHTGPGTLSMYFLGESRKTL